MVPTRLAQVRTACGSGRLNAVKWDVWLSLEMLNLNHPLPQMVLTCARIYE